MSRTCASAVQLERRMTADLPSLLRLRHTSWLHKSRAFQIIQVVRVLRAWIRDPLDPRFYTVFWMEGGTPVRINREKTFGLVQWAVSKNGQVYLWEKDLDRACHTATL